VSVDLPVSRLLERVQPMKKIPLTPLIHLQVFSETPGFEFSLTTFLVISEFAGRRQYQSGGRQIISFASFLPESC
jgi:hypothetical protein